MNRFRSKYNVKKIVKIGDNFIEFQYNPFNERNFLGRWVKYGQQIDLNPSTEPLLCDSCYLDYNLRQKYFKDMNLVTNKRSYQVPGVTFSSDLWPWERCICQNKAGCWGSSQRIFDIKRKYNKYQFTHSKTVNGITETVLDRQYFDVYRENSLSSTNFSHWAIGMKTRKPFLFWPNFLQNQPMKSTYYFYVYIQQMQNVPLEFENVPISDRPYPYQSPEYIYPMSMRIEVFRENCDLQQNYPIPRTYSDLKHHIPIGIIILQLYPGSAGFVCKQYPWLQNEIFNKEEYEYLLPSHLLIEEPPRPKASWINNSYIVEEDCFIPGYRNGYGGPITSFYVRVNASKPYFS